jgi:hypothetical protein
MSETINAPIPFQGSRQEAEANFMTHDFITFDGVEYRCGKCDCKTWHEAAFYDCGNEPPRKDFTLEEWKSIKEK